MPVVASMSLPLLEQVNVTLGKKLGPFISSTLKAFQALNEKRTCTPAVSLARSRIYYTLEEMSVADGSVLCSYRNRAVLSQNPSAIDNEFIWTKIRM